MKKFEKLKTKIKEQLDIDLTNFKRTRIGYSGKTSGAFTWTATCKGETEQYGSTFTATELLKHTNLDFISDGYNVEIVPK